MKSCLFALFAFAAAVSAQDGLTPNDVAKFLAGMPVRGTAADAFSRQPAWADHATAFDAAWNKAEARQLEKIRIWSGTFLPVAATDRGPVFYLFSGPDGLYPLTLFPSASTYVLCGLESIGAVPDLAKIPPESLGPTLESLRRSLNAVLNWSFFITKDMKVDLQQTHLQGTLPVLMIFIARSGGRIASVEFVTLDNAGNLGGGKGATPGVKIVFNGPGGGEQTLYYFQSDLSDDGIRAHPGFMKFCDSLGSGMSMLKAASYLIHEGGFEKSRDFILTHSKLLVQDDSGIPMRFFDPAKWQMRYFGNYVGPIAIFKQHYQPALAEAFHSSNPAPLSFGFGYRWQPQQSAVIVATPR